MLWKHQKQMVAHANQKPYSLIYSEPGTGKTLFALTWLSQFPGLKLVLTPKPALPVWADDINKFNIDVNYTILDKGTSTLKATKLLKLPPWENHIVIVNYETARLLPLNKVYFAAVVADEGHRLGTHNSKQSLALTTMLAKTPQKCIMTGTPYHDGYEKLYSMVRFLNPEITPYGHPRSKVFGHRKDFLNRFCNTYEMSRGIHIITGYKNTEALAEIIKPFTLHIKAKDVLDLPDVVERVYRVQLKGAAKKAYRQLAKESAIETETGEFLTSSNLLTKTIRLQQLATSGVMISDDKTEFTFSGIEDRVNAVKMLLEDIKEPIVIFTRFRRDVELIEKATKEKLHYLTGDYDNHLDWRAGNGRILVANIGAGAEGVRLERARHLIFWSVGWSNKDFEQAKARIIRAGQKAKTVFLHYIVSDDTIDLDIYKALTRKNENKTKLDRSIK